MRWRGRGGMSTALDALALPEGSRIVEFRENVEIGPVVYPLGPDPTIEKPRRGRPKTGTAMTNAEKQRRYRERKRAEQAK